MKKSIFFLALFISAIGTPASAADCQVTCVDVYTQDGQLIFEARKGSGPAAPKKPKQAPTKSVVKPPAKPLVKPTPKPIPKQVAPIPAPAKPVAPKPAPTKKPITKVPSQKQTSPVSVSPTSLSDRISKSLPSGGISYQPNFQPLINVPVYFWNDLPAVFRKKVDLLGEAIDVVMRPSFTWAYGDGSFASTTDPGGPFPNGKITHIYSNPGTFPVLLLTTWGGSFTHNGVERAITGQIKKTAALTIKVVSAPTRFMN